MKGAIPVLLFMVIVLPSMAAKLTRAAAQEHVGAKGGGMATRKGEEATKVNPPPKSSCEFEFVMLHPGYGFVVPPPQTTKETDKNLSSFKFSGRLWCSGVDVRGVNRLCGVVCAVGC